jgi:hypothetical protein
MFLAMFRHWLPQVTCDQAPRLYDLDDVPIKWSEYRLLPAGSLLETEDRSFHGQSHFLLQ